MPIGPGHGQGGGRINRPRKPVITTVTVTPAGATIADGLTEQLSVSVLDETGATPTDGIAVWTSSDTDVATVSAAGLVTAVAAGSATITATSGGVSDACAVTVSSDYLVVFPSTGLEIALGPLPIIGDAVTDGTSGTTAYMPWPHFDAVALERGAVHYAANEAAAYSPSDPYLFSVYYDFGACLYSMYYRTGDPLWLTRARAVADKHWASPWAGEQFTPTTSGLGLQPMYASTNTMILRAADGGVEGMWAWLENLLDCALWVYCEWQADAGATRLASIGVRYAGMYHHSATLLAALHPDAETRATWVARVVDVCMDWWIPVVEEFGSWRFINQYSSGNSKDTGYSGQPFQDGLLLEALINTHRLIVADPSYTTEAAAISALILDDCAYLKTQYHKQNYYDTDNPARAFSYQSGDSPLGTWVYRDATAALTQTDATVAGTGTLFTEWFVPGSPVMFLTSIGSVSVSDVVVTGSGFSTSLHAWDKVLFTLSGGGYAAGRIQSVDSNTQATLVTPLYDYAIPLPGTLSDVTAYRCSGNRALSGTVAITAGSQTIQGTSTAFQDELAVGDTVLIVDAGVRWTHTIASIVSQTEATIRLDYQSTAVAAGSTINLVYDRVASVASDVSLELVHVWPDANAATAPIHSASSGMAFKSLGFNGYDRTEDNRQSICTILHAFGYAYKLTADESWLTFGDEMAAAAYGHTSAVYCDYTPTSACGPDADDFSSLYYYRAKEYGEAYRASGRYFAWRLGA